MASVEDAEYNIVGEVIDSIVAISSKNVAKTDENIMIVDDQGGGIAIPPLDDNEKQLTNGTSDPARFIFEEEFRDDTESKSPHDYTKNVIPLTYIPEKNGRMNRNEDELEARDYAVEKILQKKLDAKGRALYLVKWEGFPNSANSWEPIQHLVECDKKMAEFELSGALKLAKKQKLSGQQNGLSRKNNDGVRGEQVAEKRKSMLVSSKYREYQIMDVMGMTQFEDERYYLVSIVNSTQKVFIRASLAKRVFPSKVIDFYVKNLKWKQKVESSMV